MDQVLTSPHRRAGLAALAVVVCALAVWLLLRDRGAPPAAPDPVVPVATVLVQQQDVARYLTGVGTVTAAASVTVKARVDGQLDSVGFVEGQDVKAGQVLANIDPRALQAQLAQAQAQRAKDQATLLNARLDLQRYTRLQREDAATQQTLDAQRALVAQLEAATQTDDAQISYARVQLDYTRIVAPIAGRVGARLVDPGNIVHAADANGLLVINQIDPIAVQFTLPESSFQAVNKALDGSHEALAVEAIDRDTREVLASGRLVLLNNQIDTATGTVSLKAQFANAGHALWPGQSVDARVVLGERADALTVPSAVVQRNQEGFFAYVVGPDDKVRAQPLTVADTVKGRSVIETGLAAGDRVVLDGQYRLTPGARVVEKAAVVPVASAGVKP